MFTVAFWTHIRNCRNCMGTQVSPCITEQNSSHVVDDILIAFLWKIVDLFYWNFTVVCFQGPTENKSSSHRCEQNNWCRLMTPCHRDWWMPEKQDHHCFSLVTHNMSSAYQNYIISASFSRTSAYISNNNGIAYTLIICYALYRLIATTCCRW